MILYPAIDIKAGQVVRLRHGDPAQKTVYSSNPLEVARRWQDEGASWLHIVNLDGALDEDTALLGLLEQIAALGLQLQFGGGLRSAAQVEAALAHGVQRVIIGTAAIEQPDLLPQLLQDHGPEALVAALDARDGKVATHGWQQESQWTASELGLHLAGQGLRHALYTDIQRDGALQGINIAATQALAAATGLQVIASGGLRSLEDVRQLHAAGNIAGVILGKALYEGMIDLRAAFQLLGELPPHAG